MSGTKLSAEAPSAASCLFHVFEGASAAIHRPLPVAILGASALVSLGGVAISLTSTPIDIQMFFKATGVLAGVAATASLGTASEAIADYARYSSALPVEKEKKYQRIGSGLILSFCLACGVGAGYTAAQHIMAPAAPTLAPAAK